MAVDATCASDAAIASTLGTGSRSDQVCNWFERRPIALALALLAVLALLLAVTASLAARSGRYNVDTYSTMLAVELLKVPKTFDVKNSAPGYALLLTAISYVDPGLRAAVICHGTKSPCPEEASFKSLIRLQYVAGLIALLSILVLAYRLSGNRETALLALILTFAGSRLGADTARVGIVIWITASTYLCLALSVEAHLRKSITWSAGAGLVAGLTTILYPLAAVFSGALAITLALSFGRRSWPRGLGAGLAVLAGALAVPLIVYATMPGYGPAATGRALLLQLSERIGYQPTDVSSWLASLLLPIPFFGGWFELLFSDDPAPYVRRSYEIFASAQNIPGSPLAEYAWLIKASYRWRCAGLPCRHARYPQPRSVGRRRSRGACWRVPPWAPRPLRHGRRSYDRSSHSPGSNHRTARGQHAADGRSGVEQSRHAVRLGLRHRLRRGSLSG